MVVNIIAIKDPRAEADLARAIKSCEEHGYDYEICYSILAPRRDDRSKSCTIGHMIAISHIYTSGKPGIVIEHDSVMQKMIDFPVEDGVLYNLHGSRAGFGQLMTPGVAEELLNHSFDIDLRHPMCDIYWAHKAKGTPVCSPKFRVDYRDGYVWGDCGNYSIRQEAKLGRGR